MWKGEFLVVEEAPPVFTLRSMQARFDRLLIFLVFLYSALVYLTSLRSNSVTF